MKKRLFVGLVVLGLVVSFIKTGWAEEEGLICHLRFDEGSGEIAKDSSGNNNNGKIIGGATYIKEKYGFALSFDGVDDYIDCGRKPSLDDPKAVTLEAWIYPKATGYGHIICRYEQYVLRLNGTGIYASVFVNGYRSCKTVGSLIGTNKWYHVAMTYDTSSSTRKIRIFVNGEEPKYETQPTIGPGDINTGTGVPMQIGRAPWSGGVQYFKGLLDEIKVYKRALAEEEIKAHAQERKYTEQLSAAEAEKVFSSGQTTLSKLPYTLIYLPFDDEKNITRDKSGNNNHGLVTPPGATWGEGILGSAINAEKGQSVSIPHRGILNLTKEMSMQVWIKLLSLSPTPQIVMKKLNCWEVSIRPNSSILEFMLLKGGNRKITVSIPVKKWVQVTATYDGTTQKLYINGTLVQSRTFPGRIISSPRPIWIGRGFKGLIDEFRLLQTAITPFFPALEKEASFTASTSLPEGEKIASLNVGRCKKTPLIDGILNDPCWREEAREINLRDDRTGKKPKVETKVCITYDEENLYLAFSCWEPEMEKIVSSVKKKDDIDLYKDDCVEIFIRRQSQTNSYYHLGINSLGTLCDAIREYQMMSENTSWDSGAQVATSKGKQFWTVELSIPFSSLGGKVRQGETWRVNFNRERYAEKELSSWSPTGGYFQRPQRFGTVCFGTEVAQVATSSEEGSTQEATLIGILRNEEGYPVPFAEVENPLAGIQTDYAGRFIIKGFPAGKYNIGFRHPKYSLLKGTIEIQPPVTIIAPLPLRLINPYRFHFLSASAKGYEICKISYLDSPQAKLSPAEEDSTDEISLFATPGEYEPVSFVIYTDKDMEKVRVKTSKLTQGKLAIPAENIEIRWVKSGLQRIYTKANPRNSVFVDRFLVRKKEVDIPKKEFRQVCLIIKVPEDTKPGTYKGEIEIKSFNLPSSKLVLNLEVLPFALEQNPNKKYGMFYHHGGGVRLDDIRAHGADALLIWHRGPWINYTKEGDKIVIDYRDIENKVPAMLKYGFSGPFVIDTRFDRLPVLLGHENMQCFGYYRGDGKVLDDDPRFWEIAKEAITGALKLREERDWPEFYFTHGDEPFGHEPAVDFYIRLSKAVRQVPNAKLMITMPASPKPELMIKADPYIDVRVCEASTMGRWLASGHNFSELEKELKESGDKCWLYYNPEGPRTTPESYRIVNGLYMWVSPIEIHIPWTYSTFKGNPFDATDGNYTDMGFAFISPEDGTIVSTKHWEAFREGIDDMKYLYTLEQCIKKAKRKDSRVAKEAEEWLKGLKKRILNVKPKPAWNPFIMALADEFSSEDYQDIRYKCAQYIIALQ